MDRSDRRPSDAALVGLLGLGLLAWYLGPFVLRALAFPLGPDAPVYLWWTRLAAVDGLSAVPRPGVPALALVLQGTLHLPLTAVLAALECALGVALGLAAAALARRATERRWVWVLAGILTGTFGVHLAAGYLANLAFALLFLAAAVELGAAEHRGTVAATLLLAAAGLAHPLFSLVGLVILMLTAALAFPSDRHEALRIGLATLGAGALVGLALLTLQVGPAPLASDTSRDGFLRRAGLTDVLRAAYLDRFIHRWTRYVQWVSVPLAVAGLWECRRGFVSRFLRAWGTALIGGIALSLLTGWFPADRFITFGYVVPILAAFGLGLVWTGVRSRRAIAAVVVGSLVGLMVAGALIAWTRQEPFLSRAEVAAVSEANPYTAGAPARSVLGFFANDQHPGVSFLATRAANVIRAGVPPDRIRDVFVIVPPPPPGEPSTLERRALSNITRRDAEAAIRTRNAGPGLAFLLIPFDRVDLGTPAFQDLGFERLAPGVFVVPDVPTPTAAPVDPLVPSSHGQIVLATAAALALLVIVGYGWMRAAGRDRTYAAALAPAAGTAATVLVAIALERLGLPLTGTAGPSLVSALAGAGGYLAWYVLERRARA